MQRVSPVEAFLKRDRAVVLGGLIAIAGLAWAYMLYLAQDMDSMTIPYTQFWGAEDFSLMFLMWAVMMVAMMVPTAATMILLFATVNRRRREREGPFVSTGVFVLGYIAIWSTFAVAATLAQWGLHTAALLSPMMSSTSHILGGALLLAAGLFQWSPLKNVCLTHCRSPLGFLMADWREGAGGAFNMGLRHGVYCLGCCWVLMGLLFVLGVMNLLWIAALAGFVLLEKVIPKGPWLSRAAGVLLVVWGSWVAAGI